MLKIKNMDSREKILARVKANQPASKPLPQIIKHPVSFPIEENFISVLTGIGGVVIELNYMNDVIEFVTRNFVGKNIVTTIDLLFNKMKQVTAPTPHELDGIDLAILEGQFGVAENGSIWITDKNMGDRALPYITQHLAIVLKKSDIVPTMHHAYDRIGNDNYNLGTFIAGPSKTADIEQSLVLGAHGAKSLIVFLI
jgi:L-lactate dehydrogenase complex protein LldG